MFSFSGLFLGLLIFIMSVLAYFLPSFVAYGRNHNNSNAILALNFFLGWTFIGWVVSLVWALTNNVKH